MNLLPFIELARDENPNELLTADEVAACLYRAAQLAQQAGHDVGVLLKPGGTGGMCPVGRISLDILIDIPDEQEYDCFTSADGEGGGPGPANPTWNKLPFKVGVPPSGASMDRVRRPLGSVPVPEPVPVPVPPVPQPEPPAPVPPCQCGEVVELLAAMRLENAERYDAVRSQLNRLETASARARKVRGKVSWSGQLDGEVSGVPV